MVQAASKKQLIIEVPSKLERQEAFLAACKKEQLSAQEIVERASVFPVCEKSRVLKWPKL